MLKNIDYFYCLSICYLMMRVCAGYLCAPYFLDFSNILIFLYTFILYFILLYSISIHYYFLPVSTPPTIATTIVTPSATTCIPACMVAVLPSPASIVRLTLIAASSVEFATGARAGKISYKLLYKKKPKI